MTRVGDVIAYHLAEVQQREELTVGELRRYVDEALDALATKELQEAKRRALAAAERAGAVETAEAIKAQWRTP